MFQYIGQSIIFSKGAPYRRSMFTNRFFIISLAASVVLSLVIGLGPYIGILDFFTVYFFYQLKK